MENTYCFEPNEVFEARNKAYGAFQLRHLYHKRVLIALAIATVGFTLAVASPGLIRKRHIEVVPDAIAWKGNRITEVDLTRPELKVPPPEKPRPQPKIATARFVPFEPTADEDVPEDEIVPSQTDLKDKQAGVISQQGDPVMGGGEVIVEDPAPQAPEPVLGPEPEPEEKEDAPFQIVEQQPEFPGGDKALAEFLKKEVKYPEIARRAGIEGRVHLRFVVGRDGQIRDVEVLRGPGGGCDEEAMRAIKAMPRWIPGKQRGTPVSVRYALSIRFGLN